MTARALTWFEDDDPRDFVRWAVAAAVVVLVYAALIMALVSRDLDRAKLPLAQAAE